MFEKIQRGVIFDRSQFTRGALKELRQRATQDDGVACYWLGMYYLSPIIKSGRSKALAFFTKGLRLAQKTDNTELEADARRKLLNIQIITFFKKYSMPWAKVNQLQKRAQKEAETIASLYASKDNREGLTALFCDYAEAFLPISFSMLGVAGLMNGSEREEDRIPTLTDEECQKMAKENPALMKRVRFLNSMFAKVYEIDNALQKKRADSCAICKGCAKQKSNEPAD